MKWSHHNSVLPPLNLLQKVRFGLMDIQFFQSEVATHPVLKNTSIDAAVQQYQSTLESLNQLCTDRSFSFRTPSLAKPRDAQQFIFVFGGWSAENPGWSFGTPLSTISVYNPQFDVWLDLSIELASQWTYLSSVYIEVKYIFNLKQNLVFLLVKH